jgi:uncharacterized phage-associated protein
MTGLMAPTSAAAAANEFLKLGWNESGVPPVTQMKLQKLLYYAHGWHLAIFGKPLFDEDFEAWPWGPVVRDIYFQTKDFGKDPIVNYVSRLVVKPNEPILSARFDTPKIGEEELELKSFLRAVWETHKSYTGVQLSNSTHAPGQPWAIMKERYGSLDNKPTIPNDLIAEVFKKKLAANDAARRVGGDHRSSSGDTYSNYSAA